MRLQLIAVMGVLVAAQLTGCAADAGSMELPGGAVSYDAGAADAAGFADGCLPNGCAPDEECIADECVAVDCSENVTCSEAGTMCDTLAKACYPTNGACKSANDCPVFGLASSDVTNRCSQGFCQAAIAEPQTIPGLTPVLAEPIAVLRPKPGEVFATQADVVLSWVPESTGHILVVLERLPTKAGDLLRAAVWGMSVAKSGKAEASIASGKAIVAGSWTKNVANLPTNKTLYFFIQAVDQVSLLATSKPIVFRVGGGWPKHGDACQPDANDGDLCDHPVRPLMCWLGSCRRICVSHGDCAGVGHLCGPLRQVARICVDK